MVVFARVSEALLFTSRIFNKNLKNQLQKWQIPLSNLSEYFSQIVFTYFLLKFAKRTFCILAAYKQDGRRHRLGLEKPVRLALPALNTIYFYISLNNFVLISPGHLLILLFFNGVGEFWEIANVHLHSDIRCMCAGFDAI